MGHNFTEEKTEPINRIVELIDNARVGTPKQSESDVRTLVDTILDDLIVVVEKKYIGGINGEVYGNED